MVAKKSAQKNTVQKNKAAKDPQKNQVLARKYRPKNFSEFVGQTHTTKTLSNALESGRLHHAFLFTGTRGVGKTTVARILAKCLNCEQGISATPCGECDSCQEINAGQSMDLIEFDAASHTRVEEMREVLENAQYLPSKSRYKIYLIDEVHMLSKSSFNALLKTLEEPPSHIKFLLATTDPHKLPITVLSRCLQFNLQKISVSDIKAQLIKLLELENIKFDESALEAIAKHGQGSMRDALSLLDQSIAYGDGQVLISDIKAMLSLVDSDHLLKLLEAIIDNDAKQVLALSAQLSQNGGNLPSTLQSILEVLHQLSIELLLPNTHNDLSTLAKKTNQAQIQLYYQIITEGLKSFSFAPNESIGFEMALLRMLAFNLNVDEAQVEKKKP